MALVSFNGIFQRGGPLSKIAIITDSNSGITQDHAKKLGISVLPMPFTVDGEDYFEDINLTQDEFYGVKRPWNKPQHCPLVRGFMPRKLLTE